MSKRPKTRNKRNRDTSRKAPRGPLIRHDRYRPIDLTHLLIRRPMRRRTVSYRPVVLSEIEDGRVYKDYPRRVSTRIARVRPRQRGPLAPLKFDSPKKVIACVRRRERKEVIFAIGRAGRGAKRQRPKYNENSNIRCK
jgi:hypothetical protein